MSALTQTQTLLDFHWKCINANHFFGFLQAERCVILHSYQQHITDAVHRVQLVLNVNLPWSPFKCVFEHRKATFKICQQILFHICLGDCTLTPDTWHRVCFRSERKQSITEHTERVWHNTILTLFPYGAPVKHTLTQIYGN